MQTMAKLIPNDFSEYEFTEQEEIESAKFTTIQKQGIQNIIAKISMEKNSLEPNPENFNSFIQKESYLRGQIDSLKYLLELDRFACENEDIEV